MTPPPHNGHPWLRIAARVALASTLLGLVLWLNREEVRVVLGRRPDYGLFALGFCLYAGGVLLAYGRWFTLVRALGLPFRPLDALRLGLVGTLFTLVIPGGVGGDIVKAAYLCRQQERKTRAVASVVVDRIVGLMGLFLLAAATGAWGWGSLVPKVRRVVVFAWCALGVSSGLLALAFAINPRGPLARRLSHRKRISRLIAELHAAGVSYRRRFGVVALGVVLGAVTHTGNVLAFFAVNHALFPASTVPSLADHFRIVPVILLATAIPLPFGALGATEQVSASLLRLGAYRGGALAMMGFRCLQYAYAIPAALVYMANRRQVQSLRQEAEQLAEAPITEEGEPEPASSGQAGTRVDHP
jgi:glycosyltransferase 2 family protein